jgi:hypothetical protein
MNLHILLFLYLFTNSTTLVDKSVSSCQRKQLEGLYTYVGKGVNAYTYRTATLVIDIGMNIEYIIKWKGNSSCDHDLVVSKVTPTIKTPAIARNLYKVGDILNIQVLETTKEYMKYRNTFKGKSMDIIMYRIPEEMLMGK